MENNNPGLKLLKQAFEKFARKYDADDLASRAVRSIATGSKATVDHSMQEFPKDFISQMTKDIYGLITSQDVADGISSTVRSFDEEKINEIAKKALSSLKDPDKAMNLAKQIKDAVSKASTSDIMAQIDGLSGMVPGMGAFSPILSMMIKPIIEEAKYGSEEDVANKIMEFADNIPTDMIASTIGDITRQVTPERVSKQANDIVASLPSPHAVADIAHGIGSTVSQQFDHLAKIVKTSEAKGILADLADKVANVVEDKLDQDQAAKKTFKKGGSFDL